VTPVLRGLAGQEEPRFHPSFHFPLRTAQPDRYKGPGSVPYYGPLGHNGVWFPLRISNSNRRSPGAENYRPVMQSTAGSNKWLATTACMRDRFNRWEPVGPRVMI
jgi:hypothetical protein